MGHGIHRAGDGSELMADHGARCQQCGGRGYFGGGAYAHPGQRSYDVCDRCHGAGRIGEQPTTEEYVWVGQGVQVSAAALYAEADAKQFADDAIAADREKYGRWIAGELFMPVFENGEPNYDKLQ